MSGLMNPSVVLCRSANLEPFTEPITLANFVFGGAYKAAVACLRIGCHGEGGYWQIGCLRYEYWRTPIKAKGRIHRKGGDYEEDGEIRTLIYSPPHPRITTKPAKQRNSDAILLLFCFFSVSKEA
ncbi:hypothetical protein FALBO_15891 [Fusarium albosuccineum]|uniref:Uncharacterized protein n=1 Tax=Fusarium albosuccineum TaxID=1237068 RepID=A0A8H4KPB8_9HYPO|nr:hypothetical protein FALBO_15891 [Fusarium albosuccineum]